LVIKGEDGLPPVEGGLIAGLFPSDEEGINGIPPFGGLMAGLFARDEDDEDGVPPVEGGLIAGLPARDDDDSPELGEPLELGPDDNLLPLTVEPLPPEDILLLPLVPPNDEDDLVPPNDDDDLLPPEDEDDLPPPPELDLPSMT